MKPIIFIAISFFLVSGLGLSPESWAHGMSESDKQAIIEGGNLRYLELGVTHMLTGYDHLLFIFGIIFFLSTFRDIVKYITAFTLGHSVTLIFATFNQIQMNYFLIDAVIGLSVAYIAFANLDGFRKHLHMDPPNSLVMITLLGFIHGFGLSTRLQELPLSNEPSALLANIVSFNIGIEFGQIAALSLMLLLLAGWRKAHIFNRFSTLSNNVLVFAGFGLFLFQMHGYTHLSDPDGFGFSTDNHVHEHMRLDAERAAQQSTHESL